MPYILRKTNSCDSENSFAVKIPPIYAFIYYTILELLTLLE